MQCIYNGRKLFDERPETKGQRQYDDLAFAVENFLILESINIAKSANLSEKDDRKAKAKMVLTIDPSLYLHNLRTTVHNLRTDRYEPNSCYIKHIICL